MPCLSTTEDFSRGFWTPVPCLRSTTERPFRVKTPGYQQLPLCALKWPLPVAHVWLAPGQGLQKSSHFSSAAASRLTCACRTTITLIWPQHNQAGSLGAALSTHQHDHTPVQDSAVIAVATGRTEQGVLKSVAPGKEGRKIIANRQGVARGGGGYPQTGKKYNPQW